MSGSLPSMSSNGVTISIQFSDSATFRSVEVDCVIDQTDFGDVIGVEIIGLHRQLSGGLIDAPRTSGGVRWSYDNEIDSFYVHVMEGRSQVQTRVTGKVSLDASQRVVLLEVPVPRAAR